jgi:hypothetical protein
MFLAALLMLADGSVTAQDKGKNGGKKHNHHEATIVKVDVKAHAITVEIHEHKDKKEKGKGKHEKHYKLAESVKIVDAHGHVVKLDIFKKGDHVKIVEHEGVVHELHHKTHGKDKKGK